MKNILISVVLPVYNGASYLDEAIVSILKQTHGNFELIVINDGSTDGSLEIIEKYANQDERIVIIDRENKGLVHSLNEGLARSKGEYIARMDADDESLPTRLECQLEHIDKYNLDICGGHCLLINEYGKVNGLNVTPMSHEMCSLSMLFKVPFSHPSVMVRKKFLDHHSLEYGQSKFKMAEDFDLWVRMHQCGAIFGNVDEVVLRYRVLNDSLSSINNSLIRKETKAIIKLFYRENYQKISHVVKNHTQLLNSEEKSLIVRYAYNSVFRELNLSNINLIKKIEKKIVINSILSEIAR